MSTDQKTLQLRRLSSTAKIFPHQLPPVGSELIRLSVLADERAAWQVAACNLLPHPQHYRIELDVLRTDSEEAESIPAENALSIYEIKNTPAEFTALPKAARDSGYLDTEAGSYPDLLLPKSSGSDLLLVQDRWQGLYLEFNTGRDLVPGRYSVTVRFSDREGAPEPCHEITQKVEILPVRSAPETVWHTEWFHADCVADYYGLKVWSEDHWRAVEDQIAMAADHGINLILTPLFTPPLDTEVGGERTTVQLVDIKETGELSWDFDFSRFERWVRMCQKHGIKGFELCHLFTQWGAEAAPKIMVEKDGKLIRRFFWDTPADGEYADFLRAFLPELLKELDRLGIRKQCFFHISDEPRVQHMDSYRRALGVVEEILKDEYRIDALSFFEFYESGLVPHPIPSNDHIEPFLEAGIENLWTYYCTSQHNLVSNRYFVLPGVRTRILGVQMFKYGIKGFLHWGYNFYNAQYSKHKINPFRCADSDGGFHAGDPYLVYPGPNFETLPSLRLKWMQEAFQDMRALQALADKTSHEEVVALIDEGLEEELSFSVYPSSSVYLLNLRRRVNERLREL